MTIPELRGNILVIDDERGIRALCGDVLRRAGHQVEVAETAAAGLAAVGRTAFDLVLCDINLPDQDGVSLLPRLLDRDPAPTVILITAYPSIDTAVRGMKLGARDYLGKPFSPDELRLVVGRALAEDALRRDNAALRRQLALGGLLGDSAPMVELRRTIEKVGASDATVLVTGESGTGKELVARALHLASRRSTATFVPVNCGALVGSLLDSELFGHVRGAFTGADHAKRGLVITADQGTLLLDEIAELPLELQPKLLRALEARKVRPVGGATERPVDVRIIAATHRDLREGIGKGTFRQDLYFRLGVIEVRVPPLRERLDDLPLLAEHFLSRMSPPVTLAQLPPNALKLLEAYDWPGNVRELRNVLERLVISGKVEHLAETVLPLLPWHEARAEALAKFEISHLKRALAQSNGSLAAAARALGVSRQLVHQLVTRHGL